jgi:dipeptidyl aminopeptidase/acylaminoacyl peptidase
MIGKLGAIAALALFAAAHVAVAETPAEVAAVFGAGESYRSVSLSPDASHVAFLMPQAGQGLVLMARGIADDAPNQPVLTTGGKDERLNRCHWVSARRLVCGVYGTTYVENRALGYSRLYAVDIDGKNLRQLSSLTSSSHGLMLSDGDVIDWLPDEDGSVMMARAHLPSDRTGSLIGSEAGGLAVDRIDTATLQARQIEPPRERAVDYISDGRGNIRLIETAAGQQMSGIYTYLYRRPGVRAWETLGQYNASTREGFNPFAVDHDLNLAYGLKKRDGRLAFYSVALDGTRTEKLILARDDVDIGGPIQIGRRNRVVGVSYHTDRPQMLFFDPEISKVIAALGRAIPNQPNIYVVDSSADERKLLIFAGSDTDPGVYYLFDRDKRDLHIVMSARLPLEGRALGKMTPIRYRATDGTEIPAYLTLPPGKSSAQGLPAIVMPHGGPSSRDSWGFDWLAQFYAAEGFAVLQPQFRGSSGYGDDWYQKNGFRSWRTSVGDVVDAGRWLATQGMADPKKLAIVGWSYGGYAALQSAVIAPDLFKAVVAIAPVTNLATLKEESRGWTDNALNADFIGSGQNAREGSPAQNADKIKAPVLLVHGTVDANVAYAQSTLMASKLKAAGGKVQLITFEGYDHQLDDPVVRTKMLSESDAFLRSAIGQ